MKIDHRSALWRGRNGKLWRLADRIEELAQAVRYADKPSDLTYPISSILTIKTELRDLQMSWLAETLGLDKRSMGRWPKL